ncbi:MAG: putative toxin-antitoxin system toxin component, PIN family, partial [Burkholderiaceae bacterium]
MSVAVASVVLDTNVALDLLVFADPRAQPLHCALDAGSLRWIATPDMRQELERVLAYSRIARYLTGQGHDAQRVLARFDALAQVVERAAASRVRCSDRDDQIFIDLALAHTALLLSKDAAVLSLRKRLAAHGVAVHAFMPP